MAAQWITEGVAGLEGAGNKLTCTKATSGDVVNALWEDAADGVSSGQHYWKLAVLSVAEHTSIFAGVTDKDKFKPGWALKALLYGRNLSSGSALLVEEFGPALKAGDVLGIFVKLDDNVQVYLDVNGSSLGLAFDLPKSTFKSIYPVVQFNGTATVQIDKVDGAPGSLARPAPAFNGIEGDWELSKNEFKVGGAAQELDGPVKLSLKKTGDGEKYFGHLKIVNSIGFGLEKQGSVWSASPGMSTKMMGSPEAMKLEGQMTELTASPTKVELDGSNLVWTNESKSMESKWQRFEVEKSPVTRNPF